MLKINRCFHLAEGILLVLLCLCTLAFVGCGAKGIEGEKVAGSVKLDGNLLESGSITFKPLDDQLPKTGAVIKDGKYETIVPLGKSKVEIRSPVVVGQQRLYETPDSPMQDVIKEALPAKFHDKTELEIDVVVGTSKEDQDWNLSTK